MLRAIGLTLFAAALSACATTSQPQPSGNSGSTPPTSTQPASPAPISNENGLGTPPSPTPAPLYPAPIYPSPQPLPPGNSSAPSPAPSAPSSNAAFKKLLNWGQSDTRPALMAFRRNCDVWNSQDPDKAFSSNHPEFGTLADWQALCVFARQASTTEKGAKSFFESHFYPLILSSEQSEGGLLTGYYQPEVNVRSAPLSDFTEPVLAVPSSAKDRLRPRSEIAGHMSRVIAYGRPMDVFFMQIQGSGIIVFENGYRVRAAYAANNGKPYTSIGGVLVRRGQMTINEASKQAIEAWMRDNGPAAARALMNENARYIFFAEETLVPGEGPMGAMRAPLTGMGSMAVDPAHHPYGLPVYLSVKLPQHAGDFRGKEQGQLLIAQDTGKAIRGAQRGDIYFGEGHEAGAKAGVMKHRGRWTILLPQSLLRRLPSS